VAVIFRAIGIAAMLVLVHAGAATGATPPVRSGPSRFRAQPSSEWSGARLCCSSEPVVLTRERRSSERVMRFQGGIWSTLIRA
jgi:hypothetical protein